ncbi:hypothetical protein C8R42DRAFT_755237 [Lentinula raphanica]|nr:hypothetical protein C8R42DRAFT_755237 [Lentinula raphanica]
MIEVGGGSSMVTQKDARVVIRLCRRAYKQWDERNGLDGKIKRLYVVTNETSPPSPGDEKPPIPTEFKFSVVAFKNMKDLPCTAKASLQRWDIEAPSWPRKHWDITIRPLSKDHSIEQLEGMGIQLPVKIVSVCCAA